MAEWVVDHVRYEANIAGGNLQNHKVCITTHRERKNKYTVSVDIRPPGDLRPMVSGSALRDASLHREFASPKAALTQGFRSLHRHLNNNGKNTLQDLVQEGVHWVYLDEQGKVDWEFMSKLSDKERAEKERAEFKFSPPTSEAIKDNTRAKQLGKAFNMDVELSGLDESGNDVSVKGESQHSGLAQAKKGLNKFLQTRGMGPKAGEGSQTEVPTEEVSVPGQNGPQSGATLARDEMASPVGAPNKPFPS